MHRKRKKCTLAIQKQVLFAQNFANSAAMPHAITPPQGDHPRTHEQSPSRAFIANKAIVSRAQTRETTQEGIFYLYCRNTDHYALFVAQRERSFIRLVPGLPSSEQGIRASDRKGQARVTFSMFTHTFSSFRVVVVLLVDVLYG